MVIKALKALAPLFMLGTTPIALASAPARLRVEAWAAAPAPLEGQCLRARSDLPRQLEQLRSSVGRPTPQLLRETTETIGVLARLCASTPGEQRDVLARAWEAAGPRLQRRFLSIEFLMRVQPPGTTSQRDAGETHLLLAPFIARNSALLRIAATDGSCAPGSHAEWILPASEACYVDWVVWRAARVERAWLAAGEQKAFAAATFGRLRAALLPPARAAVKSLPYSWTLHAPGAVFKGPSPLTASNASMALLLGSGTPDEAVRLLVASAPHLPAFFPLDYLTPASIGCVRSTALARSLAERAVPPQGQPGQPGQPSQSAQAAPPAGHLSTAALFLSRAVLDACSVADRDSPSAALAKVLENDPALESPALGVQGLSILNAAEAESRVDLLVRETLGLRLPLGSRYDVEDLARATPSSALAHVRDSLLADAVRRVRPELPWIHLAESVEDGDARDERLARIWVLLARSPDPQARWLRLRLLESEILFPFVTTAAEFKAVVDRLRAVGTAAKSEIPSLFPLAFRIHNSFSPELVDALDAFPPRLPDDLARKAAVPFLTGLRKQLEEAYGLKTLLPGEALSILAASGLVSRSMAPESLSLTTAKQALEKGLSLPLPSSAVKRRTYWQGMRAAWALVIQSDACVSARAGASLPPVDPLANLLLSLGAPLPTQAATARGKGRNSESGWAQDARASASTEAWRERAQRLELFLAAQSARKTDIEELRTVRAQRRAAFPELARHVSLAGPCTPPQAKAPL